MKKETEFTGFCHPAACRADLHQLHGHQQNRGAVRGERKRMDIFAALRSRNRSAGHLRALLAAGHQTGGTVCGVCESGDGAFMVPFVGGITVRGADYGEKLIGVGLVLAGTLIINGGKEQENHD